MCIAIPGRIIEARDPEGFTATVDLLGDHRPVNVALLSDGIEPGEWVLIHAGHAVARIDEDEARETLRLLGELVSGDRLEPADGAAARVSHTTLRSITDAI